MKHFEQIQRALKMSGLPGRIEQDDVTFLGEGAWNKAYLINMHGQQLVVRLPKKEVYGEQLEFNAAREISNNESCKYYYELANKVSRGICVPEFHYHVSPEFSYTVETYMGKTVDFESIDLKQSEEYGVQLGEFYRAMHSVPTDFEGFGHFVYEDGKFRGQQEGSLQDDLLKEQETFQSEVEHFDLAVPGMDLSSLKKQIAELLCLRNVHLEPKSIVNVDAKPENLTSVEGRISMVDAYPLLHNGTCYAGHVMNLYQTLLPNFYDSPRFLHHGYDRHADKLKAIAQGFLYGYAADDQQLRLKVKIEQFLLLLSDFRSHLTEAQNPAPSIQTQQYMGSAQAIMRRIPAYLQEVQSFKF